MNNIKEKLGIISLVFIALVMLINFTKFIWSDELIEVIRAGIFLIIISLYLLRSGDL